MEFHKKLKDIRLNLGMTQKEFSIILNTDLGTYQRYEYGKISPSIEKIKLLKHNFPSIDLNYLLDDDV